MRVVVLGCGGMGSYAARTAVSFSFVDELVVADFDTGRAAELAASVGTKARPAQVDVRDRAALSRLLRGAGAVLNTVGPFFRLGPSVLQAAIGERVPYFDINDDWESTEAMLGLHAAAEQAGVFALIGIGASPGISNLLVLRAMRELEQTDEIVAGFDLDAAMPEQRRPAPAAATIHGLHQLTGRIRVYEHGTLRLAEPLQRVEIAYPGLATHPAWTMGHPEAVTFHRWHPSLRTARVVMTTRHLFALRLLCRLIDLGLFSLDRAASWVERLEGVGRPVKSADDYLQEIVRHRRLPPLFGLARGMREGKPASVAATIRAAPPVGMGGATGVPLAVALKVMQPMIGDLRGVYTPEACVPAETFFDELAPFCVPRCRGETDLVLVTRSWESTDLVALLQKAQRQACSSPA